MVRGSQRSIRGLHRRYTRFLFSSERVSFSFSLLTYPGFSVGFSLFAGSATPRRSHGWDVAKRTKSSVDERKPWGIERTKKVTHFLSDRRRGKKKRFRSSIVFFFFNSGTKGTKVTRLLFTVPSSFCHFSASYLAPSFFVCYGRQLCG